MRKMGLGKMGNLSQIVPFSSDFSPISDQFHTFFYTSLIVFLAISHNSPFPPIFPCFPPFSHHFTIFPIFPGPAASQLIRLCADACSRGKRRDVLSARVFATLRVGWAGTREEGNHYDGFWRSPWQPQLTFLHLTGVPRGMIPVRTRPQRGGFGLWACLPDPKRALGAHGVPRFGEVRLRRTALTLEPCGARAGYTPPSADVLVLARCMGNGARDMQGTESGSRFFTGSVLESVACEPQPRPTGARDAGWPECSWVQVA